MTAPKPVLLRQSFLSWLDTVSEGWIDDWVRAIRAEIPAYAAMRDIEVRGPVERHAEVLRSQWEDGASGPLLDFYMDLARRRVSERVRLADVARAVAIGGRLLLQRLQASGLPGKKAHEETVRGIFREDMYFLLECYQTATEEVAAEARAKLEATEAGAAKTWEEWGLLSQILSGIDVGIVLLDEELRVVWLNQTMPKELLLLRPEAAQGLPCKEVLAHTVAECTRCSAFEILGGCPALRQLVRAGDGDSARDYLKITRPISGGPLKGPHVIEIYLDVTAQQEAQRSLARTQELLRNILNSSVGGIISTDLKGRVTLYNRTAERIFEFSEQELLGKRVAEYYGGGKAEAARVMKRLMAEEVIVDYETTFRAKSGEHVPLRATLSLLRDERGTLLGTMGFCHDLRIEEALKKEVASREQYLLSILQASMDGLVTLDAKGRIASWNRGATVLFSVDAKTALGRPVDEFLPPRERRETPSSGQTPGTHRFEVRIAKGEERSADLLVTRTEIVDENSGEKGASLVIKDVTEMNRLQKELAQAEHLAELGRLAASVAHEIKNPIAGLRGAIEILAEVHEQSDPHFEVLQETLAQIRRLDSLVKDLLSFAKPISLRLERVPLRLLLESTLPFVQKSAEEARVAIRQDVPAELPEAHVDPQQFQQVLVNLIMNGIQATPAGGEVSVAACRANGNLALEVRDTGGGIKPEDLKHIFEPFFTTKHIGTGLGLSIVLRIVSAHAGRVEVSSKPGEGTVFKVYLPI